MHNKWKQTGSSAMVNDNKSDFINSKLFKRTSAKTACVQTSGGGGKSQLYLQNFVRNKITEGNKGHSWLVYSKANEN